MELISLNNKLDKSELKDMVGLVFEEPPVGVIEFVESKHYLNKGSTYLYPKVQFILDKIFDRNLNLKEIDVNLGRGSGKSELSSLFLSYNLYWLNNLINPQSFYELAENTLICVINIGLSIDQANSVIFENMAMMLEDSDWFNRKFKVRRRDIYFPMKRVRAISGHSGSTVWRGYHLYAGVLDEINFFLDKKGKSNSTKMFNVLQGSMISRFPSAYKILSVSSMDSDDDFLSRRRKYVQEHGGVLVDLP